MAQLDAIYFHLYGIDRAAHGTYRTRDLILGYYDAYAAGDLQVWLGPEGKRTAERHSVETGPELFREAGTI